MSSYYSSDSHASRPKAPVTAVLFTVIFLLIAVSVLMFTFLYYIPNNEDSQTVDQQTVTQLNLPEAYVLPQQSENQTIKVRVFDGMLEWFNGSMWTPYANIDTLRAGDPIAEAQQAVQVGGSERSAGTLPLLPMLGEVKQERQHNDHGDDDAEQTPVTPRATPQPVSDSSGDSGGGDGNDTEASDLF